MFGDRQVATADNLPYHRMERRAAIINAWLSMSVQENRYLASPVGYHLEQPSTFLLKDETE